ncbi:hypothetical protein AX15_007281 [Amanita polypyramis BW_CC]|nr:hypothetical protein AX15_007281 [Amanita polypyramis BW_CC]
MVEALASFVFNSLLSAHIPLRHPAVNPIVTIAIASSAHSPPKKYVSPGFFTPVPRRGNGKSYPMTPICLKQLSKCQEWSRCSIRHSGWCPIHCRKLMLEEFFVNRDRLAPREPPRIPCPIHSRTRTNASRAVHNLQRRHASRTSEPVRMIAPQFSSLGGRGGPPDSLNPSTSASAVPFNSERVAERLKRLSKLDYEQVDLDEAWNVYLAAMESDVLPVVSLDDLLELTEKMVRSVERRSERNLGVDALCTWGHRFSGALYAVGPRLAPSSLNDRRRHCLLARSVSMLGDSSRALELLHIAQGIALPNKEDFDSVYTYEAIARSIYRNRDMVLVLDFLVHEWGFIEPLLYDTAGKHRTENPVGNSLRLTLHHIFSGAECPTKLIRNDRGGTHRDKCGYILVKLFCEMRRAMSALDVYHAMLDQGSYVSVDLKYLLVLTLTRSRAFGPANKLYESLSKGKNRPTRYHLTLGLQLYAQQGDHVRAEQYFNDLADHGWDNRNAKAMYMYAYAVQGNPNRTLALFNKFYPEDAHGNRLNSPNRFTFSMLIHGLAHQGDLEQISEWLQAMSKAGYQPDVYVYGSILKSFALRDDMVSIAAVLSQMRVTGVMPNVVIYNTIMSVLARRGDVDGANAIYNRAIQERIIPDRQMITTLMNAHVEAGSWEGVISVFNRFKSAYSQGTLGLGTETFNTLLKAYVQIGAPYRLVLRLFNKFKSFHIEPDAYSYSLLIQSACDAGLINVATNILRQMDQSPHSDRLITVYCLTIIMGGFVRSHNLPKARAVLEEMVQRGIEPSSISIGTLLKSYGICNRDSRNQETLALAEEFIKSLSPKDAKWNRPRADRKSALEHVYSPLLLAYSKESRPDDIERLLQDMLEAGGRPTLGILTMLLDSYRRASRVESVREIWPQIFQLGLEYAESSVLIDDANPGRSGSTPRLRIKDSILCIPLSIYMDAMSAAGLHAEVAEAWQEYQARGFGFDSHNWNHLVVALVRAGDTERSFETVEKVILPYWKEWQNPEDTLVREIARMQEADDIDTDELSDTPGDNANIVSEAERRRAKPKVSGSARKLSSLNPEIASALFGDDNAARPLQLLRHIAPNWNIWRPHCAVLKLLTMIMARLDSGHPIDPIRYDDSSSPWNDNIDPVVTLERQRQARELLKRIHQNYPETVRMVTAYDNMRRRLLGDKEYSKQYEWT